MIAPERPGIGLSSPQPGRSLVGYPDDVRRLADYLGLERVAVLGVSSGAPYALVCAYALPERLRAAVIVSGAGPPEKPGARADTPLGQRLGLAGARCAPQLAGWFAARMAAAARRDPDAFVEKLARPLPEPDRAVLARPEIRELLLADLLEAFRQGGRENGREMALTLRLWGSASSRSRCESTSSTASSTGTSELRERTAWRARSRTASPSSTRTRATSRPS